MSTRKNHQFHYRHFRIGEYAFASLPGAAAHERNLFRATNVGGDGGAYCASNGDNWRPVNGVASLGKTSIPIGIAPTVPASGTAGAFTFGTAFPIAAFKGYLHYPANCLGNVAHAAGFYWTVVSATGDTATVYNNTFDPTLGVEAEAPTTLVAFTGANAGGSNATATQIEVARFTVPAGLLALDGSLEFNLALATLTHADDKIAEVEFGGTIVATHTITTATSGYVSGTISPLGQTGKQACVSNANTTALAVAAIDTTAATTVSIQLSIESVTMCNLLVSSSVKWVS